MRTFNGSAYFNEFGWYVTDKTAAFLVPMTLINVISLVMLFIALFKTENRRVYFMNHEELYIKYERPKHEHPEHELVDLDIN